MSGAILVLVEHFKGTVSEISFEMLGAARTLANGLQVPVRAVIIGQEAAVMAGRLGVADAVLAIEQDQADMPAPEVTVSLLKKILERQPASLVFIGGTNVSAGVGAKLSASLSIPFVNFCKGIRTEGPSVLFVSQLFGGKILADVRLPENSGVVSIYPGSFPPDAGKTDRTPAVEKMELAASPSNIRFLKFIEPEATDVDITKKEILIAVGRGIQSQDNIALAEELAELLKGAVCASRPVIDQGWLPLTRQVGKSGMIVKPKLYLASGISGAPEHVEGMKNAELAIAINTDANAPIFDVSKYGICGDCLEILPAVLEEIKAHKAAH